MERRIDKDEFFELLRKYVIKFGEENEKYNGVYYINMQGTRYISTLYEWLTIHIPEIKKGRFVRVFRPQYKVYKPNSIAGAIYIESEKLSEKEIRCNLKYEYDILDQFILVV